MLSWLVTNLKTKKTQPTKQKKTTTPYKKKLDIKHVENWQGYSQNNYIYT